MDKREWQAGDLVEIIGDTRKGEWLWVFDVIDTNAETGRKFSPPLIMDTKGYTFEAEECTLLAAGDADLWTALQGLPGVCVIDGGETITIPLYRIGPDADDVLYWAELTAHDEGIARYFMGNFPVHEGELPPLKQAIQRFEAIAAYIAAKDVQND